MASTKPGFATDKTAYAGDTALAQTLAQLAGTDAGAPLAQSVPQGGERFELGALLGEGGMGRVHLARDLQFGRDVALKELSEAATSAEGARRFVIEAMVTGNLEHPGIPAVYERGTRDGRPFYAMRRVEGRPMSDVIRAAKTIEQRIALLPAVAQVANTLGFAHARGVVHRDIKPDNVLVAAHGEVVVVDWGIAKVRGASDVGSALSGPGPRGADVEKGATITGSVLGTPAYMAPEQARGDVEAIDARTDVFALGGMLYQVLTGRAPYEGSSTMATLAAALEGRREPMGAEVPAGLRAIVERAMAKDPADRYENADEFAKAIGAFMTEAVTQRPSTIARVVVGVATFVAVLASTAGTIGLLASISGLAMQGGSAYIYTALAIAGFVLLATEWATRGRHQLVPLSLALAAATFLTGIAGTFAGLGVVALGAGGELEAHPGASVPTDALATNVLGLAFEGFWEASGSAAGGAQLAALLVVLAAVVHRRNAPPRIAERQAASSPNTSVH